MAAVSYKLASSHQIPSKDDDFIKEFIFLLSSCSSSSGSMRNAVP